jgi:hypothetical protein
MGCEDSLEEKEKEILLQQQKTKNIYSVASVLFLAAKTNTLSSKKHSQTPL